MTQPLQTQMAICGECGSVRAIVPAILVNVSKLSLAGQQLKACPVCEIQARITALNLEVNALGDHAEVSAEQGHGVLV